MSVRKVYRSRSTRWLAAALSFVFFLAFLAGLSGLGGGSKQSSAVTAVGIVLMGVATAAIVWSVFCFGQMGVTSSNEGIVIRNWFRRRSIRWGDIKEFEFGNKIGSLSMREQLSSPYLQTYAVTVDERHYVMSGLSATRMNRAGSRRRVQALLDQLESERLIHLHGAEPSSPDL